MTIEQRLDRLERQNRFMKRAGAALLLAVVVVAGLHASMGAGQHVGVAVMSESKPDAIPDVVKARAFHVIGKDGTALVKLEDSMGDGIGVAGTIITLNGKGQEIIRLGMTESGEDGVIATLNGKGQELVVLGPTDGKGTVSTMNGEGQDLVILGVSTDGEGTVTTLNGKGQELVALGVSTGGEGMVTTLNGKGKELVELGVATEGVGLVTAYDPSGQYGFGQLAPGQLEPGAAFADRLLDLLEPQPGP